MLSPSQLRSLMSPQALDCSQGWLADELGWVGENSDRRVARYMQDGEEIPLTTAKHIIRIAREHGFKLVNGKWDRTGDPT